MTSPYATHEESQAVMGQPASQAQMLVERMIEARQLDEQGISPGKYARGLYQIAVELAEQRGVMLAALHAAYDEVGTVKELRIVRAAIARAEGGAA